MTTTAYDFRAPPPTGVERRVSAWAEEYVRRGLVTWAAALPYPVTLTHKPAALVTARVVAEALPPDAFAVRCQTSAPPASLFFGLPAPLVHGLVAGLLGETPEVAPSVDRSLSVLERPLFDFIARDLIATVWQSSWTDADGLMLTVAEHGPARTVWRFGGEMSLLATIVVTTPFGAFECPVVLPRSEWSPRFPSAVPFERPAAKPADRARIESLVRMMGVDLSVDLGTAEVTLVELSKLRIGDLIVLNQKVSDPLCARVGGESKLKVWPGLVGSRHAVQVHAVTGPDPAPAG